MLSIIVPTYNERENLPVLLLKIEEVLKKKFQFEVLIMDDNSPDQTWLIAKELSIKYKWLRVIRRFTNWGLSPAVVDGFIAAQGDYFLVMDADLQHDEKVIPKFIEAFIEGADIVIGSRKTLGGNVENWNLMRKFTSFVANLMAKIVLPNFVSDPMSGFFAIRKEVYFSIADKINPMGFKILLEILAHTRAKNITEIGFTFRGRQFGKSKLSSKIVGQYILALYKLSIGKYIKQFFKLFKNFIFR